MTDSTVTPTRTQDELDHLLYLHAQGDLVHDGYILNACQLLASGANPNYRPKFSRYSTVEMAAKAGMAQLIQEFLDHPATDFNPRPGHLNKGPLMLMLSQGITNELCFDVYARMKKESTADSPLLYAAIQHGRYNLSRALIDDRHAFTRDGYFHACCLSYETDTAQHLINAGYLRTGAFVTTPIVPASTALEYAISFRQFDMVNILLSVAEITPHAIECLMTNGFSYAVITLMKRFRVRDLMANYSPIFTPPFPMLFIFQMHVRRQPVIAHIMRMSDNARVLFATTHSFEDREYIRCSPSVIMRNRGRRDLRNELILALLQQGELPDPSITSLPGFSDVMLPCNERRIQKYCSPAFRRHVFHFILTVHLFRTVHIPDEMSKTIVQFMQRDI